MTNKFIIEGQCEEHFLKHFKKEKKSLSGDVIIFNCWEKDIGKILKTLSSNDHIYIIFDTDIINNARIETFCKNISLIRKTIRNFWLIQQTSNFEDELVSSCASINSKSVLFNHFGASGTADFKSRFITTTNLISKLNNLNFSFASLWCKPPHSCVPQTFHSRFKSGSGFN